MKLAHRASLPISMMLVAGAVALWIAALWYPMHKPFGYDDAFMFYRYALHVRQGLGVSWNLNGVPTYGLTSLLWAVVVLLLSYLPLEMSKVLQLGSLACAAGAMVALAQAVARNARSAYMASTWRVLPMVVLPLTFATTFVLNSITGMETMLAALLCAVFLGFTLAWARGAAKPEAAGLAGLLLFLTRPESAIVIVLTALLLSVVTPEVTLKSLARLLGTFLVGVLLELVVCKLYFHTALPLSFYMKSLNKYEGYAREWHPVYSAYQALLSCWVYFVMLLLAIRRSDWRLLVSCFCPMLVVFLYLTTVTQVMGMSSRYYVPYYAFIILPALLIVDRRIDDWAETAKGMWSRQRLVVYGLAAMVVVACSLSQFGASKAVLAAEQHFEGPCFVYDPVDVQSAARQPLPKLDRFATIKALGTEVVAPLPKGTTIAATEVGYLGAIAPQANVIDLAGLNDSAIALHGFTVAALLARKPDIIWLPDSDYSFQRNAILSSSEVLSEFDVLDGAANYGLAIRKHSPVRVQIEERLQVFWANFYPQYCMTDYLIQSTHWTGQQHLTVRN